MDAAAQQSLSWYKELITIMESLFNWLSGIISHPNTPQYCQAAVLLFAAIWGGRKVVSYIEQKHKEKIFDLAIRAYTLCKKSADILINITSNQTLSRNFFDEMLSISAKEFANVLVVLAKTELERLTSHDDIFNEMYTVYCEINILKGKFYSDPLLNLLSTRSRIILLLHNIIALNKSFAGQLDSKLFSKTDYVVQILEDTMVQIWDCIALSERQKEKEIYWAENPEQDNEIKIRKFKYINEAITINIVDAETRYQQLVNSVEK